MPPPPPHACWALRGLGHEPLIVQTFDAPRDLGWDLLDPMFVLGYLDGWLLQSEERAILHDIHTTLFGALAVSAWDVGEEWVSLRPRLREAFERQDLIALVPHQTNAQPPGPRPLVLPPTPAFSVPLPVATSLTWFEVRFVDEVGDPIGGLDLSFSILGGSRGGTTDSAGSVRIEPVDASFADVTVVSIDALRDKLAPRWSKPRKQKLPSAAALVLRELADTVDAVALENEVPLTVVITPYFRCREVSGAHFEFGRSFVRKDALQTLSEMVEDLQGQPIRKGMIFAHTDKVGPEALNKELSERRAKALFALFTQDHGAWEDLFMNKFSGGNWSEKWGTGEVQHMLGALLVTDDGGLPLDEDGVQGSKTIQAIKRFQRGDYPDLPAEQAPLVDDGVVGPMTRRELFLAYAKRISREPLPADRLAMVNGEKYMGCGEYNPLHLSAKDAESRRAVVFLFDAAAEPQGLPCKLGALGPCRANLDPEATQDSDLEGKPPYRCRIYQQIASLCPCNGGAQLNHDLIIQLPYTLAEADTMPHVLILESEDGTIVQSKALAATARANDGGFVEVYFTDLPPMHSYRLRCEGTDTPHIIFDLTPYDRLSLLALGANALDPEPFLS